MHVAITMISAAAIITVRAPEAHWNFKSTFAGGLFDVDLDFGIGGGPQYLVIPPHPGIEAGAYRPL